MLRIGYTLSSEEYSPNDLVKNAILAEEAGFSFVMISDHFHPWTSSQGQSPFIWEVIEALSQVTKTINIGTGVTCPIIRFHPVIIAHAAATAQVMLQGRFFLGVGTGENLNEHVVGRGWPPIKVRQEMLEEAIKILRMLWSGKLIDYYGKFFNVDGAKIYSLPENSISIMIAASKTNSAKMAGKLGDGFISTSPKGELTTTFEQNGGKGKPKFAQMNLCFAKNREEAKKIAHKIWPTSALPDPLNTELRLPKDFENAAQVITSEMVVKDISLGPDTEKILQSIKKYQDAGFDNIYLHNIGPYQQEFLEYAQKEILPHFKEVIKHKSDTKVRVPNMTEDYTQVAYSHKISK